MSRLFEYSTIMPTSLEAMEQFHADPRAFQRLNMFPIIPQVLRDARKSLTEGEFEFRLWIGPIPVRWLAVHEPGPTPHSFADRMAAGPLKAWRHEHIFESASKGVRLTDRITLEHKPGFAGLFSRLLFDGLPLRILFMYRHWQTRRLTAARSEVL